jgi:hypothetical protein
MTAPALAQSTAPVCPATCDVNKLAKVNEAGQTTSTDIASAGEEWQPYSPLYQPTANCHRQPQSV